MSNFEYAVIPSPRKGKSAKGLRGVPMKFANALATVMNEMAEHGWEYIRADTLPCEERQGLTGKTTNFHSVLVFRREVEMVVEEQELLDTVEEDFYEEEQELEEETVEHYEPDPETQRYHEEAHSIDAEDDQRGKSLAAE